MKHENFFNIIKSQFESLISPKDINIEHNIDNENQNNLYNIRDIDYEIKHHDDTKVYIPEFSMRGSLFTYQTQGRSLSKEDYENLVIEKISEKAFKRNNKEEVLLKIWSDAKKINNVLSPLKKLGIQYTLDLTGGSVRDFLLDKENEIKDLDFMLSMSWNEFNENRSVRNNILKVIPAFFDKKELEAVNWKKFLIENEDLKKNSPYKFINIVNLDSLKSKILQLCLNRLNISYDLYGDKDRKIKVKTSNQEYPLGTEFEKNDRLISVAKLNNNIIKTNYDIDILLTDFNKSAFLQDFDFDLCKASVCFVNDTLRKIFPRSPKHLIGRFIADVDFWADVKNKKITYNVNGRGFKEIDRSFDNHLIRIQKKYPEYELNIIGDEELQLDYINKKILVKKLNEDLNINKSINKNHNSNNKKNKI